MARPFCPRYIEQYSYCTAPSTLFVDSNGDPASVDGLTPVRPDPAASNLSIERRALVVCNNDQVYDLLVTLEMEGLAASPSLASHLMRVPAGQTLKLDILGNISPWIINDSGGATVSPVTWQEYA